MTTYYVHQGDVIVNADGDRIVLDDKWAFHRPTTVVEPRWPDKQERLQVGPGELVIIVAPGLTTYVEGKRKSGEIELPAATYRAARDLAALWPLASLDDLVLPIRANWPNLANHLDHLAAQFR